MDISVLPSAPRFEHHENGFGIGHRAPRLSWRFSTPGPRSPQSWKQSAYDLQIMRGSSGQAQTHHARSEQSILVPWPWDPLQSREIARVRVRCYSIEKSTTKENATAWSEWSMVETSLLKKEDWQAVFITSTRVVNVDEPLAPIRFRKQFQLPVTSLSIVRARLYITALGAYHAFLNGTRIGNHCMAPGWTAYDHRLNYQTFDVTALLKTECENIIGIEVGPGWYATRLGFHGGKRCCYGSADLAVLAQLEVATDTSCDPWVLPSNSTWTCLPSAIESSEIYDGEIYDMTRENPEWSSMVADEEESKGVASRVIPWPQASLIAPDAPPVRVTQEVQPVQIIKSPSGKLILDFGQNLVGKLRIRSIVLPHSSRLSLYHAEVLENNELCTRPLRTARCTDIVLGSGKELRNWTPAFTFHGFRYVLVDGWPGGEPTLGDFVALVMHTDMQRRGWFACSNKHINQLFENTVWGMRGNFVSVPTDCPQRDERLGWTGDLQVFANTAGFLYNTTGLLSEWLQDLSTEQLENDGAIPPLVVPDVLQKAGRTLAQAVWGDAAVLVPDAVHLYSADTEVLHRQHKSMTAWLDRGIPRGPDGLWDVQTWQLGDWLDPTAPPDSPMDARTDGVLVADAYLIHITSVLAAMSSITGNTTDAERYALDATRLKEAFAAKYISSQGNIMSNTQTAISLAICFSLYKDVEQWRTAAASLSRLVRRGKFTLSTGFVGTKFITEALSLTSQSALAYRMLLTKKCPSWLYPLTMGATTIWERWDSIRPDGSVNPGEMTSFNHYAMGSIASWLHASVAGIRPLQPGWKAVRVCPVVGGELQWAEASFDGPYGMVRCRWEVHDGQFQLVLEIPPNCTAQVLLPVDQPSVVTDEQPSGLWVGSGIHEFNCAFTSEEEWPPRPLLGPFQRDNLEDIWTDSSGVGRLTMAEMLARRADA